MDSTAKQLQKKDRSSPERSVVVRLGTDIGMREGRSIEIVIDRAELYSIEVCSGHLTRKVKVNGRCNAWNLHWSDLPSESNPRREKAPSDRWRAPIDLQYSSVSS